MNKKFSDIQYQKDAPVERLTFGPTPLQTLVEVQRGQSPCSNQQNAPFDSPIKPLKKKRKQHSKVKKEIVEMQRMLAKRQIRDSELKNVKERLKEKSNYLIKNIEIGGEMGIETYVS